jgi:hypothetical protein
MKKNREKRKKKIRDEGKGKRKFWRWPKKFQASAKNVSGDLGGSWVT